MSIQENDYLQIAPVPNASCKVCSGWYMILKCLRITYARVSEIIPKGDIELNPTKLVPILRTFLVEIIQLCRLSNEDALSLLSELFSIKLGPPATSYYFSEGIGDVVQLAKPPKHHRGKAQNSPSATSEAQDISDESAIAQDLMLNQDRSGDEAITSTLWFSVGDIIIMLTYFLTTPQIVCNRNSDGERHPTPLTAELFALELTGVQLASTFCTYRYIKAPVTPNRKRTARISTGGRKPYIPTPNRYLDLEAAHSSESGPEDDPDKYESDFINDGDIVSLSVLTLILVSGAISWPHTPSPVTPNIVARTAQPAVLSVGTQPGPSKRELNLKQGFDTHTQSVTLCLLAFVFH
ncbi:hypothetical protein B0H14DRAFT_2635116 [Mycena olivaceomarginata]|nr:hypothetical protein B0H14DRAFT_2635116 [Mycena olivaceomarginata]